MPLASEIQLPERYRVARHIASGGMASVWEAEDLLLGRVVAVKVLAAQYAADRGARARFQREARTAAQVSDQSHVVTIYDIGEHEDDAFIVMEYFAGGTVADQLRAAAKSGEPIPQETALRWLREAAAGLDVAHAAGIVHRDVKPANLLLDAQGRLAVADFGIARLADDTGMTQTGQVLGTAAYISPEQALGLPATDASDRYALAVVAYELLTGSRPFRGGPPTAQALAHAENEPPRPSNAAPELPRALDAVLLRGLAKDPGARPATAAELVAGIERALEVDAGADPTRAFGTVGTTKPTRRMEPGEGVAAAGAADAAGVAAAAGAAGAAAAAGAAGAAATPAAGAVGAAAPRPRAITPQAPPAPPARASRPADPVRPAPVSVPRGPRASAPALIGAVLATIAVIALVLVLSSGDDPGTTSERNGSTTSAKERAGTSTTPAAQQPATPPPPPAAAKGESPAQLNERGHQLILQERYGEAFAPLKASVDAYREAGQRDLPYAFALYNLGVALNRSGNPADAIPYLEERLNYDNQLGTVRAELRDAQSKLGVTGGDEKPGKGNKKKDG